MRSYPDAGKTSLSTDGVGFEPTEGISPRRFSRPLPSTALPPIRDVAGHGGVLRGIIAYLIALGKFFLWLCAENFGIHVESYRILRAFFLVG